MPVISFRCKPVAIAAGLILGALGTASAAVAQLSVDKGPEWQQRATSIVSSPDSKQRASLAILRRERTASDAMSPEALKQVGDSRASGRNSQLSRAIKTPTGTGWVTPGNDMVCIAVPDPVDGFGSVCDYTDAVTERGLAVLMVPDRTQALAHLSLLLPDGASAEVGFADGRHEAVKSDADGIVSTTLRDGTSLTVFSKAGSKRTVSLPRPRR